MQCPNCDNKTIIKEGQPECNSCGCYARLNPDNGTAEWLLDGRVIKNETMERDAWEYWKKIYPEQFEKAENEGRGYSK